MSAADRVAEFVTEHSRITLLVSLLVVAGLTAGVAQLTTAGGEAISAEPEAETTLEYVQENYASGSENVTFVAVYVRDADGNVLSRSSLRRSLEYQRSLRQNDSVGEVVAESQTVGVARAVTTRLTGDPRASVDERIDALENANASAVESATESALSADSPLLQLLPNSYEPGTASATGRRIVFTVPDAAVADTASEGTTVDEFERTVYATLPDDTATADYFTLAGPAGDSVSQKGNTDTVELVGPLALVLIVAALLGAYRDPVDIFVGLFGVFASVLGAVGLVGWLGVPFSATSIIAPILIVGLGIDFSFHVFMRYRERRAEGERRRAAMRASLSKVSVALALVTLTTAVGFLANATSPLAEIRSLTITMAVGIFVAFFVFVTLVPALKTELDSLRAWLGWDPQRSPFGDGGVVGSFLQTGVSAARVSAVAVVLIAVVTAGGGVFAWTQLDQSLQSGQPETDTWTQDLPDPIGIQEYPYLQNQEYVQSSYLDSSSGASPSQVLVRGDVGNAETLHRLDEARENATETEVAYTRPGGLTATTGPLTEMRRLAEQRSAFRDVFEAADTDDDGVPEENVTGVYDAFYRTAPSTAASVVERDGGSYESLRLVVRTERTAGAVVVDDALTGAIEPVASLEGVEADVTGQQSVTAGLIRIATENVFQTVVVSLGGIFLLLVIVYRLTEGSGTLGAVVFLPVAFVVALVSLGMLALGVPITFFTALMIGLVIGLGVDYTIHVGDRFLTERERADDPYTALERTVTGTGGALLGSTLTTVAAFGTLALAPFPQVANLGTIVALALIGAFVVSVFVLPSLLVLWDRRVGVPN